MQDDDLTRWYLADGIPPDMVLRRKDGSGYVRGDGQPLTAAQEASLVALGEAVRSPAGLVSRDLALPCGLCGGAVFAMQPHRCPEPV